MSDCFGMIKTGRAYAKPAMIRRLGVGCETNDHVERRYGAIGYLTLNLCPQSPQKTSYFPFFPMKPARRPNPPVLAVRSPPPMALPIENPFLSFPITWMFALLHFGHLTFLAISCTPINRFGFVKSPKIYHAMHLMVHRSVACLRPPSECHRFARLPGYRPFRRRVGS